MEHLEYKIEIAAPAKKVWETMLGEDTYKQWTSKSWPGSSYDGQWLKGQEIRFAGPDGSGTLAILDEVKPHENVLARHIAILTAGGGVDKTSDIAKGWIGTTEEYRLAERGGKTMLTVIIKAPAEWRQMFDEGWPGALEELKRIAEA